MSQSVKIEVKPGFILIHNASGLEITPQHLGGIVDPFSRPQVNFPIRFRLVLFLYPCFQKLGKIMPDRLCFVFPSLAASNSILLSVRQPLMHWPRSKIAETLETASLERSRNASNARFDIRKQVGR